jgi:hypothetical protein
MPTRPLEIWAMMPAAPPPIETTGSEGWVTSGTSPFSRPRSHTGSMLHSHAQSASLLLACALPSPTWRLVVWPPSAPSPPLGTPLARPLSWPLAPPPRGRPRGPHPPSPFLVVTGAHGRLRPPSLGRWHWRQKMWRVPLPATQRTCGITCHAP